MVSFSYASNPSERGEEDEEERERDRGRESERERYRSVTSTDGSQLTPGTHCDSAAVCLWHWASLRGIKFSLFGLARPVCQDHSIGVLSRTSVTKDVEGQLFFAKKDLPRNNGLTNSRPSVREASLRRVEIGSGGQELIAARREVDQRDEGRVSFELLREFLIGRRMQPAGLTVALATVLLVAWLDVDAVGAAATHHPSHLTLDQYSPLPPQRLRGVYERADGGEANWKDQDPEDQPFDVSIGSRGPIRADGPPRRPFEVTFAGRDFVLSREDVTLSKDTFPPLRQRQSDSLTTDEGDDYGGPKTGGSFSREIIPAAELDDPFVADDTFQDQGPGSVEIYKLDLFKEKTLLNPTPTVKAPVRGKSKLPKKTARINWKTKTTEYKSTSPKVVEKQSNSFEEPRTEPSPSNGEAFGVGGVPELQVGCEGLEASSHKLKRSADTPGGKEKALGAIVDPWVHVTPVSINLDYGDLSGEEGYEEMDELLNLKKLETTTKRSKQNRGDMDASFLGDNFFSPPYPEKMPVRGDLGKVSTNKDSRTPAREYDSGVESMPDDDDGKKTKEHKKSNEYSFHRGGGRKLLWTEDVEEIGSGGEKRPEKRSILWGFGEDEGAVTSDELREQKKRQEDEERRRQEYHRRRQAATRPRWPENEERRRQEEDNRRGQHLGRERNEEARRRAQEEEMRRERERWIENERRMQELEDLRRRAEQRPQDVEQDQRQRAHEEEIRRREEMARQLEERRRQGADDPKRRSEEEEERRRRHREEEMRRREEIRQQEDIRRRQEMEDARRRQDPRMRNETDARRRTYDEEVRRREYERRRMEEERRRQSPERNLSESDRRDLEERQREWMLKRQQAEEEEERRRQEMNRYSPPQNLARSNSWPSRNGSRYDGREEERRIREQQQEIERERKLRDYINRNRPINLDRGQNRRREDERRRVEEEERRHRPDTHYPGRNQTNDSNDQDEDYQRRLREHRRRMEELRRLQEYIRRNQPTSLPNQNTSGRDLYEERRIIEAARQYDRTKFEGGRRHHGPSAPTNVDPRVSLEEARRREEIRRLQEETRRTIDRERQAAEERRKEAKRREEEVRRAQSRKYEEDRKRQEAVRAEAERRRKEQIEEQNRRSQAGRQRPRYEDRYSQERRAQERLAQERLAQERRAQEQRRRQESSQAPSNLVLDEHRRAMERNRQREEQQRRRAEAEKRKQEEDRQQGLRQRENSHGMKEQWRRQEESRLNSLPVSARIIVRPGYSPSSNPPQVFSRTGFGNEIRFPGINPNRGVQAANFPAAPTRRPPIQSPGPCVWAVVQCCPSNRGRLITCFESMGCPGVNWDPNPCRSSIADAAREEVMKYYEAAENDKIY